MNDRGASPCSPPMRGVAVLGSTGSIGTRTLEVLAAHPQRFSVVALAAGRNSHLLTEQVARFRPRYAWCDGDPGCAESWPHVRPLPMDQMGTLTEVDVVMVGSAGTAALGATIAALEAGKTVALANKEILVMAGRAIRAAMERGGGALHPVDRETSATWQCLWGEPAAGVDRLILTASGGAFRDLPAEALARVTPEQALHHPTWQMGRKITVDSATLMNKGLETIEARWLFDVPLERVDVLMH